MPSQRGSDWVYPNEVGSGPQVWDSFLGPKWLVGCSPSALPLSTSRCPWYVHIFRDPGSWKVLTGNSQSLGPEHAFYKWLNESRNSKSFHTKRFWFLKLLNGSGLSPVIKLGLRRPRKTESNWWSWVFATQERKEKWEGVFVATWFSESICRAIPSYNHYPFFAITPTVARCCSRSWTDNTWMSISCRFALGIVTVSTKCKMAEILHRIDCHWLKIGLNPNFLGSSNNPWIRTNVHTWFYG